MRWIPASLTLVVLLIGLAPGEAGAAGHRPGWIDSAPAALGSGVVREELFGTDSDPGCLPSLSPADPFAGPILSLPPLIVTTDVGLVVSPDRPTLAPPFLVPNPPVAATRQRRPHAGGAVSTARRLARLQRFLF